jgi:inosine-uridine nucleoside N-ribohydrolase
MRIHVDTDLGGDTDDACAMAVVLGWPDADVVGVTTDLDIQGRPVVSITRTASAGACRRVRHDRDGRAHAGLADDLLNFQYDPVACAVALGWTGATTEQIPVDTTVADGVLRFHRTPGGRTRNWAYRVLVR